MILIHSLGAIRLCLGSGWFDFSLGLGADFTVPSTPVYFAMEKPFKLEEPSTGDRRVNEGTAPPQVAQVVPSSEKRTGKTEDEKKRLGK
ncbi:hypothetical protein AOXY_G32826 [Acipenser oxyrinchus oxyrinchus]|uniref:Uncharacterized protein n=1 Tax=Acipenser oxyrinchus oxyrinchus TaxID=40147 RepID=A0AAD8CH21_ACIOX|nr:hypothetical protein AOXY_G32826 [Acipenser oxyrinchus oxyrinchus]